MHRPSVLYAWNNAEGPLPGNSKALPASGKFVQYWFVWWTVGVAGSGSIIPARRVILCSAWPIRVAMHATVLPSTPRVPQRVMAPSSDASNINGLVVLASMKSVEKEMPCFVDTVIRFPFEPRLSSAQSHTSSPLKLTHKPITSWFRSTKCSLSMRFCRWKFTRLIFLAYVLHAQR